MAPFYLEVCHISVKLLNAHMFIQHAKRNDSADSRDGAMFTEALKQRSSYLAQSPHFCKWATPMEVSVKFSSDVRGEARQFELIWCLQGVQNE